MSRALSLLALATVLAGAACARGGDAAAGVMRADSAGVKLITSGARDTALAWTFEETDVLRDSLGEPYLFEDLHGLRILTDRAGRTYVLTRDPAVVRFGRNGRYERAFGRRGGGPGEFEFPVAIGAKGDTIWVFDVAKGGLTRFLPDLSPTTDVRLEGALAGAELLTFRTGGLWFLRREFGDTAVTTALFADTLGGAPLRRVTVPVGRAVRYACVAMAAGAAPPVFSPELVLHASGPRLLVNQQPAYELWLYEGPRAVASIRRPLIPRAPTADDVRLLYPEGMMVRFGGGPPPCVTPVEEVMAQQGVAPLLPFVFDVALLSDGTMWALRTPHRAPPVVDVFGPDGVYAGTMRGRGLPLALLPNGELLFAKDDAESGGEVIARVKVRR